MTVRHNDFLWMRTDADNSWFGDSTGDCAAWKYRPQCSSSSTALTARSLRLDIVRTKQRHHFVQSLIVISAIFFNDLSPSKCVTAAVRRKTAEFRYQVYVVFSFL